MGTWIEKWLAGFWNRSASRRRPAAPNGGALDLGARVADGEVIPGRVTIPHGRRAEHIVLLGKTGSGKSFELRSFARQDLRCGRGFAFSDQHGDAIPFLLGTVADHEKAIGHDLSDRVIVIAPGDPEASVGVNLLELRNGTDGFVQIAEFTEILRQRWHLDTFGARTDELLRNSLYALAENGMTLVDLGIFLAHGAFRARCLKNIRNAEIRQYFEFRYDAASEPMRAAMREPILNKISAFTADVRFRHLIGQTHSTFSLADAMDRGYWIFLDLPKGRLGEQAATFASLFFSMSKHAAFARRNRDLFTEYCDEVQNLATWGSDLEVMLSESRKFAVSIVSANQYLNQYPAEVRSAIMAANTHLFFQLSSGDAHEIATALDGGKALAELLKNLPRRHFVVKTGSERWQEAVAPDVSAPRSGPSDLYARCRARWARPRAEIEAEIRERQSVANSTKEALDGWE